MKYTQKPLSIRQQIDKLKLDGLIIEDENFAAHCLSTIGYHRLRGYTYPFQFNDTKNGSRLAYKDIHFQDIINLYNFDSRLRNFIFHAIEKIEEAVRTKIVYEYAQETQDSHWYSNPELYYRHENFVKIMAKIAENVEQNDEDFIVAYQQKYHDPKLPPAWMVLDILSFGALGRLLSYLKDKSQPKAQIAKFFGLPYSSVLENWMLAISTLRNNCAHHKRIWNRRYMYIILPYDTYKPFIDRDLIKRQIIKPNKLFALLSCIKYLLNVIRPENNFKKNLKLTLETGGRLLNLKDMGFPLDWETFPVWEK